jgi:hypothetical protein
MKTNAGKLFLLFCVLFAGAAPVFAHHGNAGYDYEKTITIKGTVAEWVWANPHCYLKVDVKDDEGNVKQWVLETGAAGFYGNSSDWHRNTFKPGDPVTVDVMPTKNGGTVGRIRQVNLNGKILKGDRALDRPDGRATKL